MDNQYDNREIYCRKLGHYLTFGYCKNENDYLPCSKIFDCWSEKINIKDFCYSNYKKEDIDKILEPGKPKIHTILDIIQNVNLKNNPKY